MTGMMSSVRASHLCHRLLYINPTCPGCVPLYLFLCNQMSRYRGRTDTEQPKKNPSAAELRIPCAAGWWAPPRQGGVGQGEGSEGERMRWEGGGKFSFSNAGGQRG